MPDKGPSQPIATKKIWIFLRGLVRESGHWEDFPEKFQTCFPECEVHCLDLPGNGRHWKLKSPTSIREMADFARAESLEIREKKGLTGPLSLFTISLGSMVAVEWMRQYPSDVASAILINTSLRGVSPIYRRLLPTALLNLFRIVVDLDPETREQRILELTSNSVTWDDDLLARRAEIHRRHPISVANAFRQLLAAMRYDPPKSPPTPPVLLLNSQADRLVHPSCSVELAKLWNLDLKRHPQAGHDLPLDDPDWILVSVQEWLQSQELKSHSDPA